MKNIKCIFLLGGQDLEMHTIKEILDQHNCNYIDLGLKWDEAKLSKYEDYIKSFLNDFHDGIIYGIELEKDINISEHLYFSIDHHNELSNRPSALEQIISLLNIETTRWFELVAANDKYYIPGMKRINASEEEINSIRRADRRAQGITDEDEYLAEKSISENIERINNLIIIHSYTSAFSSICDRLYPYDSLLIYTPHEFIYYGKEALKVRQILAEECAKGKIFYGGGDNGYIGSKRNKYSEKEIYQLINKLKYEFA